jgi:hypothetical protein
MGLKEELTMSNKAIKYSGVLTAQEYLEIMTGRYYMLNGDNQVEEVEKILDREFGEGAFWSYALDDLPDKYGWAVVLVECVNITEQCGQEKIYRWFEIPAKWTKEELNEKIEQL